MTQSSSLFRVCGIHLVRALVASGTFVLLSSLASPAAHAVAHRLSADGPGDSYALMPPRFGIEIPDCGHMVPHITEVFDDELKKNVFVFHAHVNQDDDRCRNSDRQRTEIRGRVPELEGRNGATTYYRWKFRLPEGFRTASSFTHIMQIKSDQAAPIITLTPRSGNLSIDGTVGVRGTTSIGKFLGVWVDVDMRVTYGNSGRIQLTIKNLRTGETLFSHNGNADTWDDGGGGHDFKFGIYRSLNNRGSLRDEQVRYADLCISHDSAADCEGDAPAPADGGSPPDLGNPPPDAGVDPEPDPPGDKPDASGSPDPQPEPTPNPGSGGSSGGNSGSGGRAGSGGRSGDPSGSPGGNSGGAAGAGSMEPEKSREVKGSVFGCSLASGAGGKGGGLALLGALALAGLLRRRRRTGT